MSEFACDAITIGVVVVPLATGLALGLLLTCISVYIIHPEPKMETHEELKEMYMRGYEARRRAEVGDAG